MPVHWVDQYIQKVLGMILKTNLSPVVVLDPRNSEREALCLDFASFLVLGHRNEVLVEVLSLSQIFGHIVVKLAHTSTYHQELEKSEYKLVLVFVLLKLLKVLIVFP